MLWSHTYTMCSEPGYIPLNYEYDKSKLPDAFKQLFGAEHQNDIERPEAINIKI